MYSTSIVQERERCKHAGAKYLAKASPYAVKSAGCRDAPLARSAHSVDPTECACTPSSVQNQLEWVDSTPNSRCSGHKLAAERATEGVPSEVVEFET